jgi:hypothetical protein
MSDMLIKFEEDNWNDLAEKFIDKHRDEWEQFVMDRFTDSIQDPPDFDDDYHGEDKGYV